MRKDKEKALTLRKSGETYRSIEKALGVSRSTLSNWFAKEGWSKKVKNINTKTNTEANKERMRVLNEKRLESLSFFYEKKLKEADKEFFENKDNTLFVAGLMIYAGEGDKRTKNIIRVSNTEPSIHKIFIEFISNFLEKSKDDIKIALLVYPDLNKVVCETYWSKILNIDTKNFHKTQVVTGKSLKRRLQYGVATSIITSTSEKKKLLRWIDLYYKQFE